MRSAGNAGGAPALPAQQPGGGAGGGSAATPATTAVLCGSSAPAAEQWHVPDSQWPAQATAPTCSKPAGRGSKRCCIWRPAAAAAARAPAAAAVCTASLAAAARRASGPCQRCGCRTAGPHAAGSSPAALRRAGGRCSGAAGVGVAGEGAAGGAEQAAAVHAGTEGEGARLPEAACSAAGEASRACWGRPRGPPLSLPSRRDAAPARLSPAAADVQGAGGGCWAGFQGAVCKAAAGRVAHWHGHRPPHRCA